jgi:uncharacterized protein YtpQ (UPF0354 family)
VSPFRLALPLIVAFTGVAARAETTDELSFTNDMVALTKRHYPNAKVISQKPLEVSVKDRRIGLDHTLWLDRVYALCMNKNSSCETERERIVLLLSEATPARQKDTARETANLRVIVRTAEGFRLSQATFGKKSPEIINRPLAENLVLVLAVDFPNTLAWATTKDYPGNRTQQDRLIAIALTNTSRELAAGVAHRSVSLGKYTLVAGNAYESSCIADHARWTVSAQAAKGRLLVAIPGADACLFGDIVTADELAEFRTMSRNISDRAERAVSDHVYQWTPEGWAKVP